MDAQKLKIFQRVLEEVPEIRYAGDQILRQAATKVTLAEGLLISKKLEHVLLRYRAITGFGRGIAAPQIGESKSVFITYIEDKVQTFINPSIVQKSDTTNFYKELCMSAGIIAADVERPEWIVLEWMDEHGMQKMERFDGFKARLYQHEVAHLNGLLNLDEATPGGIEFVNFDPLQEQLRTSPL